MDEDAGSAPSPGNWALVLGPGARPGRLARWAQAPPPERTGAVAPAVKTLEGWDGLVSTFPDSGRILVDADALTDWDGGRIEAFLDAHPAWSAHLCGRDPAQPAARRLLGRQGASWTPWPPDLDALEVLLSAPAASPPTATTPARDEGPRTAAGVVLAGADGTEPTDHDAPSVPFEPPPGTPPQATPGLAPGRRAEIEAILERTQPPSSAEARPAAEPHPPAPFFRRQVADLADIAQRLSFSLARLRAAPADDGPGESPALADLEAESVRLQQFTRTLGFTAAPPPHGSQSFDLRRLLEEQLASLTSDSPPTKTHIASDRALPVESDKALLAQALDALLFLALATTGEAGILRIEAAVDGPRARVTVAFPAGPLAGLEPAAILEPYGVADRLPDLGPNALAAACGIVRGQDGSLALAEGPEDHLIWILELPLAE